MNGYYDEGFAASSVELTKVPMSIKSLDRSCPIILIDLIKPR